VPLTLDGNTIASITNDRGTVTDSGYKTLAPGADYTLSAGALHITANYLNKLAAGETPYRLSVSYAPRGVAYVGDAGNDAPDGTDIALAVGKAAGYAILGADPGSGAHYEDPVRLTASVTHLVSSPFNASAYPTGTVEFFDGGVSIGIVPVAASGVATVGEAVLTAPALTAGGHTLKAVYSGDGDYAGTDYTLSYTVQQAGQKPVAIKSGGDVVTSLTLTKQYGDVDFTLTPSGGSGTGAYEWRSANTSYANVDRDTGEVGVTAVGDVNIYLKKLGDGNYSDSDEVRVALAISPRDVTISYVKDPSRPDEKVYDGDRTADLHGSYKINNLKPGDENSVNVNKGAALFADPNAGEGKPVSFTGFTLGGAVAKVNSYHLTAQPSDTDTTATVTKRTPTLWEGGEPVATGISFGQYVGQSALTGAALGVTGSALAGSIAWDESDAQTIPARFDTELGLSGYSYGVVFTPYDDVNYNVLTGTANIAVAPATPRMAGGAGKHPQGSTIFTSGLSGDTLAGSTITGDVVYDLGGEPQIATGLWGWDEDAVDVAEAFPDVGMVSRAAIFTPDDGRLNELDEMAEFAVYSPRTDIVAAPAISSGVFGATVGGISFMDAGKVVATSATFGDPSKDITTAGAWSWKEPGVRLTSIAGKQNAVAVFTPGEPVDFAAGTGYIKAEIGLDIIVEPVGVTADLSGVKAPSITYGEALAMAGLSGAGYVFNGATAVDADLDGSLEWETEGVDPKDIVPGAEGYETSQDGNGITRSAIDDGVYFATAVFTPDPNNYGSAYKAISFPVKIEVGAKEDVKTGLEDEVAADASKVLPVLDEAWENYTDESLARFREALAAAEEAASSGALLPQGRAEGLLAELKAAKEALAHNGHPLITNSAIGGVKQKGQSISIKIHGAYVTVTRLTLNGEDFTLSSPGGYDANDARVVMMGGVDAGVISYGSLVVNLFGSFVDTLPNGEYALIAYFEDHFEDRYLASQGEADFTIDRPVDDDGNDGGGKGATGKPSGGKGGGKSVAKSTGGKVKVTFNANGGKASGKAKFVKSIKKGSKLGKLRTPTRKGYSFRGWYTKKSGGKKVSAQTKAWRNVTYYAHWKEKAKYGKVARAAAVYVRGYPSAHMNRAAIVGHMKRGQEFKITGKSFGWYMFEYKGKTRYVYAKYIKVTYR
jgi:uncharacterized repeat protein (TIGR02543 family)